MRISGGKKKGVRPRVWLITNRRVSEILRPMFSILSRFVINRPWAVILGWLVVTAGLHQIAPHWDQVTKDDDVRFFPPDSLSVIGQDLLERGFPADASSSQLVLVYERKHALVTPDDLRYIDEVATKLHEFGLAHPELGIRKLDRHSTPVIGPRLIGTSADGRDQAVLTIARLDGTHLSKRTRIAVDQILEWLKTKRPVAPSGLELEVTGSAVVGHDTNKAAGESIQNTTNSTIILVVLILLVVYRSPLLAMVPLVTIALSVFVSLRLIALLTRVPNLGFQVISITRVFIVVVLFGAGTDYCLFLIARYCEELGRGRPRIDALREAIHQVGTALVASAGTVIVGLGMLFFSDFAKVKYTGPTIALSLSVALVAALTLAPAMLIVLRGAIFWPLRAPRRPAGAQRRLVESEISSVTGFWARVADLVVAYPLLILSVCLVVLAPLAVVGARTKSNHNQLSDLDPDRPSVVGANVVRQYFAVGELSPAVVLLDDPRLDFRSPQGREAVDEINRKLRSIDNIADVRSLTQPLGNPTGAAPAAGMINRLAGQALNIAAESRYVSVRPSRAEDRDHITRFDVLFKTDPFAETSLHALERIEETLRAATAPGQPLEGTASIGIAGSSSMVHDLKRVTTHDEQRMYVLVTLGVYAILVLLLRRPGICLYLIATVVLGYLASLGLTDLVFHALYRGTTPWGGLDWTVGFFLFVILVAVGEDYNILLMARVIEEERIHGTIEGTRRAVAHTGGIISSCGLIMAGTFGSMLTGSLTSLRELGFALGLGILLDTFLVRPILVPAFVVLTHRVRASRRAPVDRVESDALVTPVELS
jgi:putative drug exporter of the RND superfamily